MNREEFLQKLFCLYSTSFNKGNGQTWIEAYKIVLSDNIDYDLLYNYMISNYSGASAPTPAFLKKNATYKITKTNEQSINYDTILADSNGSTYEFSLDCPFGEARTNLERKGLSNVRYKFPVKKEYQVMES